MTIRRLTTAAATVALALLGSGACGASPLRDHAGPYELQVLVDGMPVRTFDRGGETWALGRMGDRYTLRVVNRSGRRIEAVVSVDGRDAVDGKPADFRSKRGYLVPAWGQVDIDGWRLSQREAAAFRFSTVADSYAARTGTARDVGVIGVAVFPERWVPPPRPRPVYTPSTPAPPPWSYDERRYEPGAGRGESSPPTDATTEAPRKGPAGGAAPPASAPAPAIESERSSRSADGDAYTDDSGRRSRTRPGLGTSFGESVSSHIREVEFVRQSSSSPALVLGVRYNDREGLLAMGIDVDGPGWSSDNGYRRTAEPFPGRERTFAEPPPGWSR